MRRRLFLGLLILGFVALICIGSSCFAQSTTRVDGSTTEIEEASKRRNSILTDLLEDTSLEVDSVVMKVCGDVDSVEGTITGTDGRTVVKLNLDERFDNFSEVIESGCVIGNTNRIPAIERGPLGAKVSLEPDVFWGVDSSGETIIAVRGIFQIVGEQPTIVKRKRTFEVEFLIEIEQLKALEFPGLNVFVQGTLLCHEDQVFHIKHQGMWVERAAGMTWEKCVSP